jgi:hypothetical protein
LYEVDENGSTEGKEKGTRFECLAPRGTFRLPLNWYCLPLRVDMNLVKKKPDNPIEDDPKQGHIELYKHLTKMFCGVKSDYQNEDDTRLEELDS